MRDEDLVNLYEETEDCLKNHNKTWEDIEFITIFYNTYEPTYYGDYDTEDQKHYRLDIDTFKKVSKDINYNGGWGNTEINETLKIVGKDWWLERAEYDGREWWEYKEKPKLDETTQLVNDEILLKQVVNPKDDFTYEEN